MKITCWYDRNMYDRNIGMYKREYNSKLSWYRGQYQYMSNNIPGKYTCLTINQEILYNQAQESQEGLLTFLGNKEGS